VDGKSTGLHYQKRSRPVADSYAVDAKRDAGDSAHVSRQHFSALPFATVVDCVFRTSIALHNHGKYYLVIRRECHHSNNIETLGHAILICKIQYFLVNYLFPYKYTIHSIKLPSSIWETV
jgi:hypothetical protein